MRRIGTVLIVIMALVSAAQAADIGLSPPRAAVVVPRGATVSETATVFSTGAAQDLSVTADDWVQNDTGGLSFLPAGGDPYSATNWLSLSSDAVRVPANGSVDYRYVIHVPDNPALSGTYRTVVFFTTQPAAGATTGTTLTTTQRIGEVVYVTIAGTEKPSISLSDFYRDGAKLMLTVANDGNVVSRLGGQVQIRDRAGKTVDTFAIGDLPVQRGGVRKLSWKLPQDLGAGTYVALAIVKPDNAPVAAGQLQIQLP